MFNQSDHEPPEVGTQLLIPYFNGDVGVRPLTTGQPAWMCPYGIHINGAPYSGTKLDPNLAMNMSVVVCNVGAVPMLATVSLYWADPGTFTSPEWICDWLLPLGPSAKDIETPSYAWKPADEPKTVPAHVCLLAAVTSTADPSSGSSNVVNDRHYAQQNLNLLIGTPGQKVMF